MRCKLTTLYFVVSPVWNGLKNFVDLLHRCNSPVNHTINWLGRSLKNLIPFVLSMLNCVFTLPIYLLIVIISSGIAAAACITWIVLNYFKNPTLEQNGPVVQAEYAAG